MNHDYSKAAKYGTLVNVTEGKIPIFKTSVMKSIIKENLVDFTENDYLLVSGPSFACIIASNELFSRFDTVKFLIFDAKQQDYVVRHLNK
jgi:hypothetical protein